jgi:predicted esterase
VFVLHGYGQLASDFLQEFSPLFNEDILFIAPEALNRFYVKGTFNQAGATWMTKEARTDEINDYLNYLEEVYRTVIQQPTPAQIIFLGFSQGSSTVSRWANATAHRFDKLVIYAGEIAADVLPLKNNSPLLASKNYFAYGNTDKFIPENMFQERVKLYDQLNLSILPFEGGHDVKTEVVKHIIDEVI